MVGSVAYALSPWRWRWWIDAFEKAMVTSYYLMSKYSTGDAMIKYDEPLLEELLLGIKSPPLLLDCRRCVIEKVDDKLQDFVVYYARVIHRLATCGAQAGPVKRELNGVYEKLLAAAAWPTGTASENNFARCLSPFFVARRVGRLLSFLLFDEMNFRESELNGMRDAAKLNSVQLRRRGGEADATLNLVDADDEMRQLQHDFLALLGLIFYYKNHDTFQTEHDPLEKAADGIFKFKIKLNETAPFLIMHSLADKWLQEKELAEQAFTSTLEMERAVNLHDRLISTVRGPNHVLGYYYPEPSAPIFGSGVGEMFEPYDLTPAPFWDEVEVDVEED
jgi:hypothetical protein